MSRNGLTEIVILEKQSLLQMEQPGTNDRPQVVGNTDDEETDPLAGRQNPRRGAGLEALDKTGTEGAERNTTESNCLTELNYLLQRRSGKQNTRQGYKQNYN